MANVVIKGWLPTGCNLCPFLATSIEGIVCRAWELQYEYPKKIDDGYSYHERDESCPLLIVSDEFLERGRRNGKIDGE